MIFITNISADLDGLWGFGTSCRSMVSLLRAACSPVHEYVIGYKGLLGVDTDLLLSRSTYLF